MANTELVKKYKKVILDYCKAHDGTSFAELQRAFVAAGLDFEGGKSIMYPGCENLIIWCNWNDEAITAFHELSDDIILEPCPAWAYLIDGMILPYPLAFHARCYKTPHWVPYWVKMRH